MLIKWKDLPDEMKNSFVKEYYNILKRKESSLVIKRMFDVWAASFLLIVLSPFLAIISLLIKIDSKGPVIFKQNRVTAGNKDFMIYKFRTMVDDAENLGSSVTVSDDPRVTRIGRFLRKYRIDEIPQLINVLKGEMTFVGTRPEVRKYVDMYSPQMMATLLLPAGITSEASIAYKEEEQLLASADDADEVYIDLILPAKMKYNLRGIKRFSLLREILTLIRTVISVFF